MFNTGSHKELKSSLESIGACIAIFEIKQPDHSFELVTANSRFELVLGGKSVSECIGSKSDEMFERYIVLPLKECFKQCVITQSSVEREIVIDSLGMSHWWRFIVSPIIAETMQTSRLLVTCIEITDKKMLEQQLSNTSQRFEAVVESAYDGIITIDEDQNIKLMNSSACDIFQIDQESVIGMPLSTFIPQRYRAKHPDYIAGFKDSTINSRPMQTRASVSGLRQDGTEFPLEVTISKINVGGKTEMTAVLRDISEKARLVEELARAAIEDHLTGLSNRRSYELNFTKELQRSERFKSPLSMVIIDIDKFKCINDDYGHMSGDQLLQQLADLLRRSIRDIDSIARWGGEEFVVLLPETDLEGALSWSEKMRLKIKNHPFVIQEQTMTMTASFGATSTGGSPVTQQAIFERADKNLYLAKQSGRNKVVGD